MADRVYSVRYDIVAEAGKAIETFNSLQNPLYNLKRNSQKLSSSLMTTVERLNTLKETLDKISSTSRNIEISVTFDIASFNRNLKEMELNARASANRIRGTFESVFKDTHGDYMKKQSLLGTPIEQGVSSGDKELRKRLKKENKTMQSLIGKMREARKQADIYTIAKRNLAGNVSEKDAISSISSIWKGFGKTSLASLKKKIREGVYDTTVLLDKAEKDLWRSLNAGALAPLENGSFLNLVDVARDNTDKIFKAIEERRKSNIANIASVQKEQKDIAKNTKPLMGSQKVVPGQPFLSEISTNPREIAKISEAYTKMLRNISKIGNKNISVNVRGNYRSHMESLAEFAKTMPLLKSRTVKVNVNVSGLSKTSLSKIKELSGITDKKVPVSLTLSYKNARDQVPRTLGVLQRIIAERGGVKVPLTIDRTKVGGQLNSLVRNLRTLIAENRLTIPVNLQSLDMKKPKNVPTINVKAKVTGLTSAVREANKAFQERVRNMKNSPALKIPIQLKWGDKENNMRAQIKRMQSSIPALKVSVDLTLAKAQIDDLAAYIQRKGIINMGAMSGPKSQGPFRNYRPGSGESFAAGAVGGGRRGSGGGDSGGRVYGGGGEGSNFLTRLRRFAYPLTGNLSYGASSPMALQMFKDMPVMMGVGGAIGAVTNGIGQAFEYQDTMRVARSILERSYKGNNFEKDYRNMEMTARNVARNTKFTGKEAADAVRFMAMAGLDIPKINSSIKPIADIALIGRNNLGDIADIMTNVQTTYKIPADKMERMADAMANTFTKTNVDMMMIAESLKYAGGIAQLTGTSLGDSLAMIGIMGNNGIQGSMAGTSTRMMMQNMIRPNKGQAAMWKSLGISTTDEHGFVKDPIKLLGELKGYVDKKYGSKEYMELGKGEEFKNKALGTLVSNMFRVTSTAGVAALLRDYDKLVELSESNKSSSINGLSSRLSGFQQNEVKGLVAKVSSSLQEQILQIIEKNTGWIKQKLIEANEWMSSPETKSKLESLIETLKNIVDGFINVGRVALWAYEKFNSIKIFGNGLVDFLIKFQLYMTAIGSTLRLVLSPLNIFSGFNFGGGMGAAGAVSSIGRIMASSKPRVIANAIGQRVYNTENDGLAPITTVYNSGSYKRPYSRGWYSPLGQMPVVLGPIGARNLRDEQQALATISPIQQRMAMYQRSRSYMTRGMTKKQKALQYASIDRQVAAMRSQIASARTAAYNETLAYGIMSNAFPLLYRRTSPVIHGRTTVPFAYNREMRPMPFYQYAKNASAIKYGGAPIAEYAGEYRKRAGMYATMALSGKNYKKHAEHMRLAEMYRKAAQQAEWMQIQERKAALERMKKAAMASRRPQQLLDSELISAFIMSRGFKRSKGLIGESLRANFRAGRAMGAFRGLGGIKNSLISSLTTGFMGLSKAMGLVLSPIGLATAAITTLGAGAYYLYKKEKEGREGAQRTMNHLKKVQELTNSRNGGGDLSSLPESSPLHVGVAWVNRNKNVISQSSIKGNSLLKNNPYFRDVVDPDRGVLANSKRYRAYRKELYDKYIANGWNVYGDNIIDESTFNNGNTWYKSLQGASMLQGSNSNRVRAWEKYISNQAARISAIKDVGERNKAWGELEKRVNEVSEKYKLQAQNLQSVIVLQEKYGGNLKNIGQAAILNTSEYRIAEAKAIANLMTNMGNNAVGHFIASHVLDAGIKDKTGAAIRALISDMPIGVANDFGQSYKTNLSFDKSGNIDWKKLQETLEKNGIDFKLTVDNKISVLSSLLAQIKGNPYYAKVTEYLQKILNAQLAVTEAENTLKRLNSVDFWRGLFDGIIDGPNPVREMQRNTESKVKEDVKKWNSDDGGYIRRPRMFRSPFADYANKASYSTTESMGNNKYITNASYGKGYNTRQNVVVNVGGITVNNDADINEIEERIERGVVTAMRAVMTDQSNDSIYNI